MMAVKAYKAHNRYLFVVTLDDTKKIPDPSIPAPKEGAKDTRRMVQDPAYVREWTWGEEPPEGQTTEQYLQACKREALLLGEVKLAEFQPPQEISI